MSGENAPTRLLVVANETVGGKALIDAVKARAERGPIDVTVICPQNQPQSGLVVYDESVRTAAENRLALTLEQLRRAGIHARGEVMDPDPYAATTDAVREFGADEIFISTHPETRSGWLRRDLVDRVRSDTGLPVEHIVVDLEGDRAQRTNILVVANQTVGGEPLFEYLKRRASREGPPLTFVVVAPQSGGGADTQSPQRLARLLDRLHVEGWEAIGQVMDPDPYTAIQNALQFYTVDEIVISTFPETASGWLRGDLIGRVRASTTKPVEHVVVTEDEARRGATDEAASARSAS
jgi:hypothetical protein